MIWLLVCLLVLPFGLVLVVGAPYLPTRRKQIEEALDMLALQPGELLVDLGCGDGAVLRAAARRRLHAIGYELNPFMYLVARIRTWRYRQTVSLHCRDFWKQPLPPGTRGVFVFLLDPYMAKLDEKLSAELPKGAKLLSYTFEVPGKKPVREDGALRLYRY